MFDIAVGMCAYNEENIIEKSIRSIFVQKLNEAFLKEVIVIASGCTDGTVQIVTALSAEFPQLRLIIQNKREGKNSAINLYLDNTSCDIVVMLNADNVFATETSIEKLILPFSDASVGITGGRPQPVNNSSTKIGYAVNMMWLMHHNLATITPKIGEIIAFRNIGLRLETDMQSDEDTLRMKLENAGYVCKYVPDCIVYNRGPETEEDFIKQRTRVNVGECTMTKRFGYKIPTWNRRLLFRSFLKSMWQLGFHPIKTLYTVRLEKKCRKKAIEHVNNNEDSMCIWERVDSTKKL